MLCFEAIKFISWSEHKYKTNKEEQYPTLITYNELYKMASNYEGLWKLKERDVLYCGVGIPSMLSEALIIFDGKYYLMLDPEEYHYYVQFLKDFTDILNEKSEGDK